VKITWDEPKRAATLAKRGLDLAGAERFTWNDALVIPAKPDRYGRPRFMAIGRLDGRETIVIFSYLGSEAVSVISMRHANTKERKLYAER